VKKGNKVSNKKILFVDDSLDHQELVAEFYFGEGYEIVCASNGQEALDLLETMEKLPAFILLDLMMPVMDGHGFRDAQLNNPRLTPIPIVIMTADINVEAKAKKLNANAYIVKPANVDDLLNAAKRYCG
jgi:CheY-like chemotaxis protein